MVEPPESPTTPPPSLPSTGARVLAFVAILVGGLCGGLIGYGFTDLQCVDELRHPGRRRRPPRRGHRRGRRGIVAVSPSAMGEWAHADRPDDD